MKKNKNFFSKKLPKQKYLCQFWAKSKPDLPPFTPFPETWKGCVGTFLISLDPNFMRNRQLSTSSVRIYHQIQKKIYLFLLSQILHRSKIPGYFTQCQTRGQSPKLPLNPFPGVARGAAGTFLVSLDPTFMPNRQLSTSSVRIYHQIQNIFTFKLSNIASK